MLGKSLAKVEPQPTTREQLLKKNQIQWAQVSQQATPKLNFSDRRREGYANAKPNGMVIHTIDFISVSANLFLSIWTKYIYGLKVEGTD